ncbi:MULTISPECIES: hypothetical protein [Streptomyces]|uniref:hypothetical protein n=1 Tax=Streptomyces TaxID=1883 RepID=UPI00345B8153
MTIPRYITHRLASGSKALGLRLRRGACSWCARSYRNDLTGLKAALGPVARGSLLAGAGWGAIYGVAAAPDTLWIIALAWGIGAWNLAPTAPAAEAEEPAEQPINDKQEEAPAATHAVDREELCALVRELAQDGAGAHLSALAEALTGDPQDTAAVRTLCATHGVPVANSVRQPGRGVSTGVKVDDLPPLSPPPLDAPGVAVVDAGQSATTESATATTTPAVEHQAEGAMLIIRDPAHHVHAV